jgi:hypothetical protein
MGRIVVLLILVFILLDNKLKEKDSGLNGSRHSVSLSTLNFVINAVFDLLGFFSKYMTLPEF